MTAQNKQQQEETIHHTSSGVNDNNSSNSSGSTSRNLSSKGGGYAADCSSLSHFSESSSESLFSQGKEVHSKNLHIKKDDKTKKRLGCEYFSLKKSKGNKKSPSNDCTTKDVLPQWQGVRVSNPMDPRIDLSAVDLVSASKLYKHDSVLSKSAVGSKEIDKTTDKGMATLQQTTSPDTCSSPNKSKKKKETLLSQYNDLINSLEQSSSIQALSHPIYQGIHHEQNKGSKTYESDSNSSMLVLAPRVKRKYQSNSILQPTRANTGGEYDLSGISLQQESSDLKAKENHSIHSQESSINSSLGVQPSSLSSSSSSKKNTEDSKIQGIVTDSIEASGAGTGSTGGSDQARIETKSSEITKPKSPYKSISTLSSDINADNPSTTYADDAATQERLALKKRKRLDKRREYEEEVRRQHDQSSNLHAKSISIVSTSCQTFQEGEIILMEDALSFTSSARLIVQSKVPFLAVHVNAAFSRFTGMHNCRIIGKPLSKILSLIDTNNQLDSSSCTSSTKEEQHRQQGTKNENNSINNNQTSKKAASVVKAEVPFDEESSSYEDKQKSDFLLIEQLLMEENCINLKKKHKVTTIVDKSDEKNGNVSTNSANEGSNNSSITSKDDSLDAVRGVMSICVIVSTPPRGSVLRSKSTISKRPRPDNQNSSASSSSLIQIKDEQDDDQRKKCSSNTDSSSAPVDQCIRQRSHFLVQLFPLDEIFDVEKQSRQKEQNTSVSSTDSTHVAIACG